MVACPRCGLPAPEESRFCARCGASLSRGPAERRALVTVLFCDLAGSTTLGERLDAEALRDVLRRYYEAASVALRRHGGEVAKFIGDAVMGVFGLPRAHEDDALRACRAALDIMAELDALNAGLEEDWGVRLAARIGVQSGEIVTGAASEGQTMVAGDTVNTAARLEQAAPEGGILIGDLTRTLAGPGIETIGREQVRAKGKARLVEAHCLVALRAAPSAPAPNDALIGRDEELAVLRGDVARAARQHVLRTLVGEPGIGKSRLAAELIHNLPAGAHAAVARCPPYGEGAAFWALREILEAAAADDVEAPGVLRRLAELEDGPADATQARRELATMAAAWAAPLVLVVEDAHWAQPALLDLLEGATGAPLLLLLTARPELLETRPALEQAALRLGPLDRRESDALLAARGERSADRRTTLVGAAGGNPLFLEQLSASDPRALPPTLRALLAARLDLLGEDERAVIDVAAVMGRDFFARAVAELLDGGDAVRLLHRLALRELVDAGRADAHGPQPRGLTDVFPSDDRWSFRHGLLQDVAYATLPKTRRAELHVAFADALQRRGGVPPGIVAWHLERATELHEDLRRDARPLTRRAADLLEEAGQRAREVDNAACATRLLERAARMRDTQRLVGRERRPSQDVLGGSS